MSRAVWSSGCWPVSRNRAACSPARTRVFLFIGVLGGFTTFSAFGYETFQLLRDGQWLPASGSVALQVVLGIGAVWAGHVLSRLF